MNADKTLLTPLCKRLGATLSRRGMLFVGLGIVIIMSAAALLAPWLSPYDPTALHLKSILVPPSAQLRFREHLHSHRHCLGAARRILQGHRR